jgi:hypothetical protein
MRIARFAVDGDVRYGVVESGGQATGAGAPAGQTSAGAAAGAGAGAGAGAAGLARLSRGWPSARSGR